MDLQDFQQIQGYFQQLEFKVWEHSNLKVSNLTLKDRFFLIKNWYWFRCLDLKC